MARERSTLHGLDIRLNTEHISRQTTDIIINFTRPNLDLNKSVLRNYLSDEYDLLRHQEDECRAKAPEDLEPGEYVVTRVNTVLQATYIYHGCCISDNGIIHFQDYQTVIEDCFEAASSMGFNDITIPLFKRSLCWGHPPNIQSELEFATLLLQTFKNANRGFPAKTLRLMTRADDHLFEDYQQAIKQHKTQEGCDHLPFKEDHFSINQAPPDQRIQRGDHSPPLMKKVSRTDAGHGTGVRPKEISYSKTKQIRPPTDPGSKQGKRDMFSGGKVKGHNKIPEIMIYIGDLTKVEVDAIVHGTKEISDNIDFSTSVGRALKQVGGPKLEAMCSNLSARGKTVFRTIKVTDAGRLKCNRIIHVATSQSKSQSEWVNVIWDCLEKADELKFLQIAFPAFGPHSKSVQIKAEYFQEAINQYTQEGSPTNIKEIHIVVQDAHTRDIFKSVLSPSAKVAEPTNSSNLMVTQTPVFTSRNKQHKTVYKGVEIIVKEGDITEEHVDCIVHGFSANFILNEQFAVLDLSGGIGECIKRRAGESFYQECLKTFVPFGGVKMTNSGNLPCMKVLHADINPCIGDSDPSNWAFFMEKCLKEAFDERLKSVSFPITGLGFISSVQKLAEHQILGVQRFIDTNPKVVGKIIFVTSNDAEAKSVFTETVSKYCGPNKHNQRGITGDTEGSPAPSSSSSDGVRTYAQATRPSITLDVDVILGDITFDTSDMIVHPTSNSITGTGINFYRQPGISISQNAGKDFNEECRNTNVPSKRFTVTAAGVLPCKKVLHVDAYSILGNDTNGWKRIIVSSLQAANDHKMTSIAFPTFKLGTVPTNESEVRNMATCFKDAIGGYSPTYSTLKKVRFVVHQDKALHTILNELLATPQSAPAIEDDEFTITLTDGMSELDLTIVCGDLTTERCDAIVHATGNPVEFRGQSGEAIRKAGGRLLEAAIKIAHYKDTPVVFTEAGNLICKKVLHLDMTCKRHENKIVKLKTLIMESLVAAEKEGIGILSYPALGTGKWGCKPSQISTCFKDAIREFNKNQRISHLHEIRLVVFEKSMMQEFTQTLEKISSAHF